MSRPLDQGLSRKHRQNRFDGFLARSHSWTRLPGRVQGPAWVVRDDHLRFCMSVVTPSRAPRRNTCFASLVSGATSVSCQAPSARGAPAERGGSAFQLLSLRCHDGKGTACRRRALLPSHGPFAPLDPPAVIGTRRWPSLACRPVPCPLFESQGHLVAAPGPGSCMLVASVVCWARLRLSAALHAPGGLGPLASGRNSRSAGKGFY